MTDGVTPGVDEATRLVEAWRTAVDAPPGGRVHGGVSPSQYRTWSELRQAQELSRHAARRVDAACMAAMQRALDMFVSRKARGVMRAAMHRVRAPERKQRRREGRKDRKDREDRKDRKDREDRKDRKDHGKDRKDRKDHGRESALAALALTVPLGEGKWVKWLPHVMSGC